MKIVLRNPAIAPVMAAMTMALLVVSAPPAQAQTDDELDAMLISAQEAYDNLEIDAALDTLDQAIELIERDGSESSIAADVYIMAGTVAYAATGDEARTRELFGLGLLIDRAAILDPYYTTPVLQAMLDEVLSALPEPAPVIVEPEIVHTPAVTIEAGHEIEILVETNVDVDGVMLHFRPFGATLFEERRLGRRGDFNFAGVIPGEYTEEGVQLEYFLDATGLDGTTVAHSGSSGTPHVVVILGGSTEVPSGQHVFSFVFGLGTGGGLATGEPLVQGDSVDLNPGVALTPLHLYLDTLFRVADGLDVGPFLRFQMVLLEDGIEPEPIVGLKLKLWLEEFESPFLYASGGLGYGYVRHTVDLKPTVDFVDTTQEGPFHVGAGFGVVIMFSDTIGLANDFYTMVLFDTVSVQLDYSVGLYMRF